MNNRGFTLIEMLVALSIFSLVVTLVLNTFVHSFAAQKKVIEMQVVQREGAYLMESLSRDIRMATDLDDSERSDSGHVSGSTLIFTNHGKKIVKYCLADSNAVCNTGGNNIAFNTTDPLTGVVTTGVMNSSEVQISNLVFSVSAADKTQPFITIYITLQSAKDPAVTVTMQTSVAMRLYS